MTPVERRNKDIARRYIREVLIDRNTEAIEELFAPPAEWEDVSLYGDATVETYDDLKRLYREYVPRLDDDSSIDSVVAEGDEVMVRWTATGHVQQGSPSVPVPGGAFETTAVTGFRLDEGRIVGLHVNVNELDLLPEVSWPAIREVIQEMQDGVLVLDEEDYIVHVNPASIELFDRDRSDLVGEPVETFLEGWNWTGEPDGCVVKQGPTDGRYFDVSGSPLTDEGDDRIGRMIVLRDVTERRRRIQQLEVLNRVLRHDLRNALQVVQGRLGMARERAEEPVASLLTPAQAQIERLLSTADTARHVQTALDGTDHTLQDLGAIASSLVHRTRDDYAETTVETSMPASPTVEAPTALEAALWELLENAAEHAGERPHIEVGVRRNDDTAEFTVADDGPGLPAHERAVIAAGEETDLEHGSGLGLWLAHWVIAAAGGGLEFSVEDGTTAHVTLPLASTDQPRRTAPGTITG